MRLLDERRVVGDSPVVNVEHILAPLKDGFRPFVIIMSSGNKYPVPRPEFILATRSDRLWSPTAAATPSTWIRFMWSGS